MKFNYKGRGFVVVTLAAMLVVVGTVNYQLSRKSLLETSKEFTAYEQAQNEKNTDTDDKEEVKVVDSKENQVEEKVTEASKQIEKQLTSEKNMKKATYILDMKMTREKQRNSLTQDLNEMINNPSTSEEARKEASSMKIQLVKDQEAELKIENILSTKGFENALVYISEGKVNVVVSEEKLDAQTNHMVETFKNADKEFGAEIEIEVKRAYGPFNIDETDEIVQLAKKAFSNMNIEGKTASTGGGSDTNILNKNGIKSVNLGIGMKKAHTLEEYIAIEDLINSAVMVGEIIKEA